MKDLIIQIVAGLAVLGIAAYFGIGQVTKVRVDKIVATGSPVKKWKWVMAVAVVMILCGLAYAGSHNTHGSDLFRDPSAAPGLAIATIGLITLGIGKFGVWLNRAY